MSAARTKRGSVDRSLSLYLRREVYPHAVGARRRLDDARIGAAGLRTLADLDALEPMQLADANDGSGWILQPTRDGLLRTGSPRTVLRVAWAGNWGRWSAYMRRSFEPRYRPVHFFDADGVPVGASVRDLVRLSGLGARWVDALGATQADTFLLVGGASGDVAAWELSSATRRKGVAFAVVDGPDRAASFHPTVLVGRDAAVADALAAGGWPNLRLVVVLGRVSALTSPVASVNVRRAWAPPGARAAWYECSGGPAAGWHTNPGAEVIEVDEAGEVLWTALGWAGTVFLRLRTDFRARIETARCPSCGSTAPRLFELPGRPALARFLAADTRVADFQLTSTGADVLPVRPGANVRLKAQAAAVAEGATLRVFTKRAWKAETES